MNQFSPGYLLQQSLEQERPRFEPRTFGFKTDHPTIIEPSHLITATFLLLQAILKRALAPTHPPIHPSIHPFIQYHTFLHKKGATGNLLFTFLLIFANHKTGKDHCVFFNFKFLFFQLL